MRSVPTDHPGPSGPADPSAPPAAAADVVEDDGTVPDKQLSRWRNEGGAWLPGSGPTGSPSRHSAPP